MCGVCVGEIDSDCAYVRGALTEESGGKRQRTCAKQLTHETGRGDAQYSLPLSVEQSTHALIAHTHMRTYAHT